MKPFESLRRSSRGARTSINAPRTILNLVPENRIGLIDQSLEKLGITMESGALRDVVSNVCGALIVKQEYPESAENLKMADDVIQDGRKDLGFSTESREKCNGDHDAAAEHSIEQMKSLVEASYAPEQPQEFVQPASPAIELIAKNNTLAA